MIEAMNLTSGGTATCESCTNRAVITLVIKWRNWAKPINRCKKCQRQAAKCLSPVKVSKKDLQTVWDLAAEMSGENSYGDYDEATGTRLGVATHVARALNRVKKVFGLRGEDIE